MCVCRLLSSKIARARDGLTINRSAATPYSAFFVFHHHSPLFRSLCVCGVRYVAEGIEETEFAKARENVVALEKAT